MTVYKSIEIVATSEQNWSDAVKKGYEEAKKSLRGIRNISVIQSDVKVNIWCSSRQVTKEDQDKLIYRVRMQINFELEK